MHGRSGATLIEVIAAMMIAAVAFTGLGVAFVYGLGVYKDSLGQLRTQQQGTYAMNELAREIRNADQARVLPDGSLELVSSANPLDEKPCVRTVVFKRQGNTLVKIERTPGGSRTVAVAPFDQRDDSLGVKAFTARIVDSVPDETVVDDSLALAGTGNEMVFVSRTILRNRYWKVP